MPLPQRGSTATAIVWALKALPFPPSVDDKVLGVRVLQWEAQLYGRLSTEHARAPPCDLYPESDLALNRGCAYHLSGS